MQECPWKRALSEQRMSLQPMSSIHSMLLVCFFARSLAVGAQIKDSWILVEKLDPELSSIQDYGNKPKCRRQPAEWKLGQRALQI